MCDEWRKIWEAKQMRLKFKKENKKRLDLIKWGQNPWKPWETPLNILHQWHFLWCSLWFWLWRQIVPDWAWLGVDINPFYCHVWMFSIKWCLLSKLLYMRVAFSCIYFSLSIEALCIHKKKGWVCLDTQWWSGGTYCPWVGLEEEQHSHTTGQRTVNLSPSSYKQKARNNLDWPTVPNQADLTSIYYILQVQTKINTKYNRQTSISVCQVKF